VVNGSRTGSQSFADVCPFEHNNGHVFLCARHQEILVLLSTELAVMLQQVVKLDDEFDDWAETNSAVARATRIVAGRSIVAV
jgi:hypothetical protein